MNRIRTKPKEPNTPATAIRLEGLTCIDLYVDTSNKLIVSWIHNSLDGPSNRQAWMNELDFNRRFIFNERATELAKKYQERCSSRNIPYSEMKLVVESPGEYFFKHDTNFYSSLHQLLEDLKTR